MGEEDGDGVRRGAGGEGGGDGVAPELEAEGGNRGGRGCVRDAGDFEVEGAEGEVGEVDGGGKEGEEGVGGGVVFSGSWLDLAGLEGSWGGKRGRCERGEYT